MLRFTAKPVNFDSWISRIPLPHQGKDVAPGKVRNTVRKAGERIDEQ
jgi:hypothetical protein